jgi:glyoxylase-like metal-dependent hydrolase (beta-lactamase superfamily II)
MVKVDSPMEGVLYGKESVANVALHQSERIKCPDSPPDRRREVKQNSPAESNRKPGTRMALTITHDTPPNAGIALEVAPGIRWLRMPLPYALDHINLWLVKDGDGWTAIDTGIALDTVRDAWRQLLPSHPLKRQIVTHFHPDHLGLAAWLERETGAPLWMTLGEYTSAWLVQQQIGGYGVAPMLAFFRSHGLDDTRLTALEQRGNSYARGVPEIPLSYRRIFAGEEILIGAHRWQVIAGFGHAAEHASLYCADLGVLISGDMLLPRISTNISAFSTTPTTDPVGLFLDSIRRFCTLPQDTLVLPSHGKPFRGIHERVEQLTEHHRERCAALLAACAAPRTAADLLTVMFEREITDAHQSMFAMGEAIAHLIHLEQTQAMRRVVENGIIHFVAAH